MRKEEQMNRRTLKSTLRSITVLVVGLLLAGSAFGVSPRTTHALDGGGSLALMAKEIADAVGWIFGDMMIAAISGQTYEWSSQGFGDVVVAVDPSSLETVQKFLDGDPTFLENPNAFFKGIGNDITNFFISELDNVAAGLEEGLAEIVARTNDPSSSRLSVTIDQDRLSSFLAGNFSGDGGAGADTGWDTWLKLTSNPQNYFDGALQIALSELNMTKEAAEQAQRDELAQSGGFLSIRQCAERYDDPRYGEEERTAALGFADERGCLSYKNITPGGLIGEKVKASITADLEKISGADEITEIIAALVTTAIDQLVQQGFSEIRKVTQSFGTPSNAEQRGLREVSQYEKLLYSPFNDGTGGEEPPPPNPNDVASWNNAPILSSSNVTRGPYWVQLSWSPPAGGREQGEILGYTIYRFEDTAEPVRDENGRHQRDGDGNLMFHELNGVPDDHEEVIPIATQSREDGTLDISDLTYVDSSIASNKRYGYFIVAFDINYNRSERSSIALIEPVSEIDREVPEVDVVPILKLVDGGGVPGLGAGMPGIGSEGIDVGNYIAEVGSYWSPSELNVPRYDVVITIKDDESQIIKQEVMTYGIGGDYENGDPLTIEVSLQGTSYADVEVRVDAANKIREVNESNNSRTLRVHVLREDNPTLAPTQ